MCRGNIEELTTEVESCASQKRGYVVVTAWLGCGCSRGVPDLNTLSEERNRDCEEALLMDILGFVGVISESERSELYGQTERLCCGCGGTAVEQKSLERVTLQSRTRPIGAIKMMDPLQPPDGSAPVAHPPLRMTEKSGNGGGAAREKVFVSKASGTRDGVHDQRPLHHTQRPHTHNLSDSILLSPSTSFLPPPTLSLVPPSSPLIPRCFISLARKIGRLPFATPGSPGCKGSRRDSVGAFLYNLL
ncbi:hypothetical protein V495_05044 [Pseudogymnoascus sp. VKM F-4514 (FW-929)]|nr:hypothetical protein V495_05044 [Pseudogymnoascus sp. VKM F-4514 (FW-929)]KFY61327.1 hypothetical protein V497_03007 [Pseudogymnoascus sp. VKM F-4516 (FW-969)]